MTISIEQAQKLLPQLIDDLLPGQHVVITRNQQPVAELVAVAPTRPAPIFGSCRDQLAVLAEDDEHLKDFREYMP